ncbi:uncharacterized protein [Nicotiana tomentosiformis]|uniref:uncharacterized protein n=1 Tax=Nicotiana tomentosiformis TaxID=4098 RepID=UPI00388C5DE5
MGKIENMFKQMMEKNADSDAQLASHNTSIRNLEVQIGQISQALNTRPHGALLSDTVVNPKGRNNTGHAMVVTTRSGKGRDTPTSNQRKLVDDEQVVQEDEIPDNVVKANKEVRNDIDDNEEEAQEEVNSSRDHIVDIPEPSLSINVPLVEALEKMPGYAKFMKDLVTKKRSKNFETIKMTHQVSAIVHSIAPKLEDPVAFMIPCTIGSAEFAKTLCDLGRPLGVIEDVLVRVDKFILSANFIILDCEVDYEVPIILSRPFLTTGKALVDVEAGELTFRVDDEKVVFHVCKSMRQPNSKKVCSFVDLVTDVIVDATSDVMNVDDTLEVVLLNFDNDEMDGFMECVNSLQGMGSYTYEPRKLSLDLENRTTPQQSPRSRSLLYWS